MLLTSLTPHTLNFGQFPHATLAKSTLPFLVKSAILPQSADRSSRQINRSSSLSEISSCSDDKPRQIFRRVILEGIR